MGQHLKLSILSHFNFNVYQQFPFFYLQFMSRIDHKLRVKPNLYHFVKHSIFDKMFYYIIVYEFPHSYLKFCQQQHFQQQKFHSQSIMHFPMICNNFIYIYKYNNLTFMCQTQTVIKRVQLYEKFIKNIILFVIIYILYTTFIIMVRNINKNIIKVLTNPKISYLLNYKNIIQQIKLINSMDYEYSNIQKQFDSSKYVFSYARNKQQPTNQNQINKDTIKYMFGSKKSNKFTQINESKMDEQNTQKFIHQKNQVESNEQDLQVTQKIGDKTKQNIKKQHTKKAIQQLRIIKQWRGNHIAPVDVVGCQRLHQEHQPRQIQKYQTLIALILSVQTKDQTTAKVMTKLKTYGLTPQKMSNISQDKLLQMIRQSNFNRRKTKNIIEVSKIIVQKGLPKNKQQLLDYPGVGMKIAMLYLKVAEKITEGIGVDTHVHRITNKLGWVKNTKNPNQTQQKLQQVFPKQYWDDINICLVGFGQILCEAKKPKCNQCPLSKQCPSSTSKQLF